MWGLYLLSFVDIFSFIFIPSMKCFVSSYKNIGNTKVVVKKTRLLIRLESFPVGS